MAVSSSLVAKAGVAGTVTVGGSGLVGTYLAWDHITLYEVEREVLNAQDLKFKIEATTNSTNSITITAPKSNESDTTSFTVKLKEGNSWSCLIAIEPKTSNGTVTTDSLITNLKAHLPSKDDTELTGEKWQTKVKNKELLLRACSKKREGTFNNKIVQGKVEAKEKNETEGATSISIEKYPELESFLKAAPTENQ